jgi:E3 ubiquitin-protein ligase RNF31
MPRCEHVCCETCAANYFTVTIRDKPVVDATCPFCQEPKELGTNETEAAEYFKGLSILLEKILEKEVYQLFQRKLMDHTRMKDPNFKWCHKVS